MTKSESVRVKETIETVCEEWGIPSTSVFSRARFKEFVVARHMIAKILRDEYNWTLSRIGFLMRRDISTIARSLETASDLMDTDIDFRMTYKRITVNSGK